MLADAGCRSRATTPRTREESEPEHLFGVADAKDASEERDAREAESRQNTPSIDVYVSTSGNDAAKGTATRPWKTLEKAAEMAKPGVTVHVAAGEYQIGDAELKTPASGATAARIRYVSDTKWGAKLRSTKTGNAAVWWNKGDYVDIEGFDISGAGALGIYNEGSHTRIISNHVHDIAAPGCPENGGAGIDDGNFGATDDDIITNWVHDIGRYDYPCQRVHGIYHSNRGGHIAGNVTFHNQGWGIHLWHAATHVTISENVVFSNGYGGIVIGGEASDFQGGERANDDTVVEHNIVFRNGLRPDARGYGILEYGSVGSRNRYINNVVYQNLPEDVKLIDKKDLGTVHADPQFVNFRPDGKGDYRLRPESPACTQGWRHNAC